MLPTTDLPAVAAPARKRIPLQPMSPEGFALMQRLWAEEDAADAADREARQDFVSRPSRFVGVKSGLPSHTTA